MSGGLICWNKTLYPTPQAALHKLRERQPHVRQRLYAYKCQACIGFHLTKLRPPTDDIIALMSATYRRDK